MGGTRKVQVHVTFKDTAKAEDGLVRTIEISQDGSNSVKDVKMKIAEAFGGTLTADNIFLFFGPNDRKIGRQFQGDPNVDEETLTLVQFSVLPWLDRFPRWRLGVKLMPSAPPPPGVAIKQAAALAEGKDPDKAVQEGRAKGELLRINQLPAPWGPKPYKPSPEITVAYQPPQYPASSSPAVTT